MVSDKIEIIVEDSEEIPTSMSKKIKVLEMPVFTDADKRNIEKMIDRLDKFMSDVYSERNLLNQLSEDLKEELRSLGSELRNMGGGLRSVTDDIREVGDDVKAVSTERNVNAERVVTLLARAVQSIEALNQATNDLKLGIRDSFNERIGVLDSKFEEKLYALDSTISYMKGLLIDAAEKVDALSGVSETKMALLVENVSEKFDAYMANLNNRLDNVVLQVIEPLNDISLRIEELKKGPNVEKIVSQLDDKIDDVKSGLDSKIEDLRGISGEYNIAIDKMQEFTDGVEKTSKNVDKIAKSTAKKLDDATKAAASRMSKMEKGMSKSMSEIKLKDAEIKSLLNDVRRINTRLAKMDDAEFLLRVMEARKKLMKYRLPKFAAADRKRIGKSLDDIENDILDLSIIALVRKKKMNITMISKSLIASDDKVRKRLKLLVAAGKLKKERLGRYVVYSLA